MRLNEFTANDIPQIGDILEIEIANEIVETVIVGINRGNYIVESTSTDLLESKLNEVDPRNYDSDWDYYDAVKRSGRRPSSDDYEPVDSGPSDEDVYYAKQKASMASAPQQRQVDGDGQAPNGERYNTVVTFTSADNNRNKIAADSYKDYHWGAKKVVDSKQANGVYTLYVVDNHKHGMWKAWKDQPAEGVAEEFNGEYDDEAGMAQSNLRTMARAVDGLIDTIKDNDNLPEWAQEKLAKAEMMTTSVWDYLLSQKEQGMDPKVQGMSEGSQRVDSLVTNGLKRMTGPRWLDAVAAIKAQVGERDYRDRKQFYDGFVQQLVDMYGKKDVAEAKQRLDPKCWDGYKKQGTKMKGGVRVNNCVKESLDERAEKKEKVKVYVKNPKTGRVVKVDFGEPGQLIKKSKKHRKHGKKRWNLKK